MSKTKPTTAQAASKRTDPLDRDGDGHPGGSLPGNQTAPYAEGEQPGETQNSDAPLRTYAFALRQFETTEVPDADRIAELRRRAVAVFGEDTTDIQTRFGDLVIATCANQPGEPSREPLVVAAGDDHVRPETLLEAAQELAIDYWGHTDYDVQMEGDRAVARRHEPAEEPDPADTFTAEEIAAGKTPVIEAEGEQVATAADATATAELARVDLDTAPGDQPRTVAVNVEQLRLLAQNKWLYKSEHGFGAASGAPFVDQATVDVWIEAGLCTWSETAGNHGGVRITHEGRRVLGVAQRAA